MATSRLVSWKVTWSRIASQAHSRAKPAPSSAASTGPARAPSSGRETDPTVAAAGASGGALAGRIQARVLDAIQAHRQHLLDHLRTPAAAPLLGVHVHDLVVGALTGRGVDGPHPELCLQQQPHRR